MDNDLLLDIEKLLIDNKIIKIENNCNLVNILKDKFNLNSKSLWLWENLSDENLIIDYENKNGLDLLQKILNISNIDELFLTVTDDNPEPWMIYKIKIRYLYNFLSSLRFFEYFIFDNDMSWLIFDTHDNKFIILGKILNIIKDNF